MQYLAGLLNTVLMSTKLPSTTALDQARSLHHLLDPVGY